MDGARRIRSEKLREHQYKQGYTRSLEGKRVEWDRENNVEYMWEHVKRVMVESEEKCVAQYEQEVRTQKVCGETIR